MIGKKINQLATELAPASTDLTIIGNPTTGVSKKITLAQLGAIFSGAVSFYTNYASFPATGTTDVIFCAKDTQKLYLWSGSAYVEVFPSQGLLDTYQLRSEKGNANGYASLDSSGKVPVSQLPSSIMEYKGTWSAATNTPTLANGTGDTGDVYICNAAGSVNFGAGAISFAVGDYVIYSGTIWQRSSGAVGTVTSVAASITGDSVTISGSPVTTSGTLAFAFAGNSTQYINGAGNLVTFPGVINEAQNLITEVYNKTGATLTKGTVVYINGGQGNLPSVTKALATGDSTSAQTYGIVRNDITNNNNGYVVVAGRISDLDTQAYTEGTQLYLSPTTAGTFTSTKPYAPNHLVYVGIVVRAHPTQGVVEVKIQNGYELDELHNVAAQTPTNNDGLFWEASTSLWKNKSLSTILGGAPVYGSGTTNYITKWSATSGELINSSLVDIGGSIYNTVTNAGQFAWQFNGDTTTGQSYGALINAGTNASDIALRIQNASSTSVYFYVWGDGKVQINNIPNATTDTDKFLVSDSGVIKYRTGAELLSDIGGQPAGTYVTSVGLSSATSGISIFSTPITTSGTITIDISTASGSGQGLLSSTDWTTFNNKQNALTNPVTGTGTTNYLPKFTGASTIGNSLLIDQGSYVESTANMVISNASTYRGLSITTSTASARPTLSFVNSNYAQYGSYIQDINGRIAFGRMNYDFGGHSEAMTLNASGNLSIGNTNDTYKLDVTGASRILASTYTAGSILYLRDAAATGSNTTFAGLFLGSSPGTDFVLGKQSTNTVGSFAIKTGGGTTLMTLNDSGAATFSSSVTTGGNILIPAGSGLVWSGDASRIMTPEDNVSGALIQTPGIIRFNAGSSEKVRITSGGRVYIGHTSDYGAALSVQQPTSGNVLNLSNGSDADLAFTISQIGAGTKFAKIMPSVNIPVILGNNGIERLRLAINGNTELTGALLTGEPDTGYGRAAIKIGARQSGQAFSSGGYLPVNVDGTVYYINLYSSTP
jgi:hypothetical protein